MSQTTTPPNAPEVDVFSPPPECGNCGGHSLSWNVSQRNTSGVVEGRLRTGDVESICVLGCEDCYETIMVVPTSAAIRAMLTREAALVAERDALAAEVGALRELVEAGRRAIGGHVAPEHCYSTGPLTGNPILDLVECPACAFISTYDARKIAIDAARAEAGHG